MGRVTPSLNPSRVDGAQAWLRWAARRYVEGPAWSAVLVQLALLAAVTIVAVFGALALATANALGLPRGWDLVFAIIIPPAAYLAAWQVLSFPSLRGALRGAVIAAGMCVGAFGATFVAGMATVGFAVPVAALLCVSVIAAWLARLDDTEAGPGGGAGRFVHTVGLVVFLAGLLPAAMHVATPNVGGFSNALLVVAALPHAFLTAMLRGSALPAASGLRRGAALVALGWILPMPILGWGWIVAL